MKKDGNGGAPEGGQAPFAAQPVLRPREQVESQIKQAIISGAFAAGERLPSESQLATAFSVSRATVREALRSLAESGLIVKTAGSKGGSFVQEVDDRALATVLIDRLQSTLELGKISYEEVDQLRNLLDVPCASLAAQNGTPEQKSALREVVQREKEVDVHDDVVPELNRRFHAELAKASGNRLLAAIVGTLHRVAKPLTYIDTDEQVGREAVKQHIAILLAVESDSPEGAAEAMRDHLAYLKRHAHRR